MNVPVNAFLYTIKLNEIRHCYVNEYQDKNIFDTLQFLFISLFL